MSDRLPWFRCFPSALLGAIAGMEADEGYTYISALLRIYETGGPVAENARTLSRRTGLPERKVAAALESLIATGKLIRCDDGRLDSLSTHDELEWQKNRKIDQSSAGKASAAKRAHKTDKNCEIRPGEKDEQNQQTTSTSDQRQSNHLDKDKEEEIKKDTSLRSVVRAPERERKNPWPENFRELVWEIFPKKDEKKDGMAQLEAIFRSDRIAFATITDGIRRLAAHVEDPKFAPALHRWLRKERWNDELRPPAISRAPPAVIKSGFASLLVKTHNGNSHEPDFNNQRSTDARSDGARSFNPRGEVQEPPGGTSRPAPPLLDLRAVGSDRR
jgi:hypothetical protein